MRGLLALARGCRLPRKYEEQDSLSFLVEAAANKEGGRVDGLCWLALAVELKNEDRGDTHVILMTELSFLLWNSWMNSDPVSHAVSHARR
jgi:hypothetical protein